MRDYSNALSNHEKALEIQQKSLPSNHPDFGVSYYKMGDYSKAHSFYVRAIENGQRSLPGYHSTTEEHKNNFEDVKKKM